MAPLPQAQAGAAPSAEQSAEDIKTTSRQPLIVTGVVIGIALLSLTIFVVYFYARIGIKKVKERAHTIREGWDEKARKRAEATEERKRLREGQKKRAFEGQTNNNALVKYVQRQIPGDATYDGIPSQSPVADRSSRGDSDGTPPLDAEPEVAVTTKKMRIRKPKRVYCSGGRRQGGFRVARHTPIHMPDPLDPLGWVGIAAGVQLTGYPIR